MRIALNIVGLVTFAVMSTVSVAYAKDEGQELIYRYPETGAAVYKNRGNVDLNLGVMTARLMTEYLSHEKKIDTEGDLQSIEYTMSDLSETVYVGGQLVPRDELAKLEGQSVWFKLSPSGDISGFEMGKMSDLTYAEEKVLKPVLASIRLNLPGQYPQLPEGVIKVGDTWDSERTFTTDDIEGVKGKTTVNATYKVKRKRHRKGHLCYEIEEIAAATTNSILSFGQMTVLVSGKGSTKSKIEFDTETGLVLKYDTRGKMTVDTKPVGKQDVPPSVATMSIQSLRQLKDIED